MSSIRQVSETMQRILSTRAKALARETGFVHRCRVQLDGPLFMQPCVWTWMHTPDAGYTQLRHTAACLGVHVTNQAIEQRFRTESACLARTLLEEAVGQVSSSEASVPELLGRFNGVYLQDGTVLSLPAPLAKPWPASSKAGQEAALRVQARVELGYGSLSGRWRQAAREAERSGEAISTPLPAGSLFLAEMGYFTLKDMGERGKLEQYWLPHAKASLAIIDERGPCWDLLSFLGAQSGEEVDVQVYAGKQDRLPVRLIAVRVWAQVAQRRRQQANKQITHPPKGCQAQLPGKPKSKEQRQGKPKRKKVSAARLPLADWTILLTNVPQEMLWVPQALVLVRWSFQIELFWKRCKEHGQLDTWRSYKPERILTEIYAKLLGLLLTYWQILIGCWQAQSSSLVNAKQLVEWMTPCLALAFAGLVAVPLVVEHTVQMMQVGCTIDSRHSRPNTYQLLADPQLIRGLG